MHKDEVAIDGNKQLEDYYDKANTTAFLQSNEDVGDRTKALLDLLAYLLLTLRCT